jgi:chromosome segregation ATPase
LETQITNIQIQITELQGELEVEQANSAALSITITSLENIQITLEGQLDDCLTEKTNIENQLNQQISILETDRTIMQGCTNYLSEIKDSFVNGHGEYELQSIGGYCVRSTDNDYDFDNLRTMYETS